MLSVLTGESIGNGKSHRRAVIVGLSVDGRRFLNFSQSADAGHDLVLLLVTSVIIIAIVVRRGYFGTIVKILSAAERRRLLVEIEVRG
jgi:hypothetical protein